VELACGKFIILVVASFCLGDLWKVVTFLGIHDVDGAATDVLRPLEALTSLSVCGFIGDVIS